MMILSESAGSSHHVSMESHQHKRVPLPLFSNITTTTTINDDPKETAATTWEEDESHEVVLVAAFPSSKNNNSQNEDEDHTTVTSLESESSSSLVGLGGSSLFHDESISEDDAREQPEPSHNQQHLHRHVHFDESVNQVYDPPSQQHEEECSDARWYSVDEILQFKEYRRQMIRYFKACERRNYHHMGTFTATLKDFYQGACSGGVAKAVQYPTMTTEYQEEEHTMDVRSKLSPFRKRQLAHLYPQQQHCKQSQTPHSLQPVHHPVTPRVGPTTATLAAPTTGVTTTGYWNENLSYELIGLEKQLIPLIRHDAAYRAQGIAKVIQDVQLEYNDMMDDHDTDVLEQQQDKMGRGSRFYSRATVLYAQALALAQVQMNEE
eukprot:CAMPEP_0172455578 /NCGR_PEP_ID=MMETSP1065-20121228/12137_1 /TAXON_ID=265537 /ORGANISM="Amphiprora paludosa, Strain CCMP125" /LENGTH=377 /DNA_ID=CAMNT_0013208043 /DNA_START=112 /DNA_END=1245 /DNA_ORIENTATION=+